MTVQTCGNCRKTKEFFESFTEIGEKTYCAPCKEIVQARVDKKIDEVLITTTHTIEGYQIKKYIDIAFGMGVAGNGWPMITEERIMLAKVIALRKLRQSALIAGGNAVVGVEIDFSFFDVQAAITASGTIVHAEIMNNF